MKRLIAESYLLLLQIEFVMAFRSIPSLYGRVKSAKLCTQREGRVITVEELCRAMDFACVLYPKPVLCLQRSAATTILLRRRGIEAEMVIGVQLLPFKSHAWVETEGAVVNDKPYVREIYRILDRC
jgi:hypothetical protein